ncbi:MAG: TetR/AcrR family transcriptional regulator C-terminal domain-containing protein [bacterium]
MFDVLQGYLKKIKETLAEGVKSGEFKKDLDIDSASIAFFGLVQSMVTLWALGGFKDNLNRKNIEELFNIYEKGVR